MDPRELPPILKIPGSPKRHPRDLSEFYCSSVSAVLEIGLDIIREGQQDYHTLLADSQGLRRRLLYIEEWLQRRCGQATHPLTKERYNLRDYPGLVYAGIHLPDVLFRPIQGDQTAGYITDQTGRLNVTLNPDQLKIGSRGRITKLGQGVLGRLAWGDAVLFARYDARVCSRSRTDHFDSEFVLVDFMPKTAVEQSRERAAMPPPRQLIPALVPVPVGFRSIGGQ